MINLTIANVWDLYLLAGVFSLWTLPRQYTLSV